MTDPSEAARYTTPPREMFKQSDDLSSLNSEEGGGGGGGQDGQSEHVSLKLTSITSTSTSDVYQDDSEIDNLGQQLSINSPEKSTITTTTDIDLSSSDQLTTQESSDGTLQLNNDSSDLEEELESDSLNRSTIRPSFDEQADIIQNLKRKGLEEGDPWYLICKIWFTGFRKYCVTMARGGEGENPGPVDNTLLIFNGSLREDVAANSVTVPEEGWNNLVAWYVVDFHFVV